MYAPLREVRENGAVHLRIHARLHRLLGHGVLLAHRLRLHVVVERRLVDQHRRVLRLLRPPYRVVRNLETLVLELG
jgi:hypothetical protein